MFWRLSGQALFHALFQIALLDPGVNGNLIGSEDEEKNKVCLRYRTHSYVKLNLLLRSMWFAHFD